MNYDPQIHHRRSIRLKTRMGKKFFAHASSGAYFVTIVTHGRQCLFGAIVDGAIRLNEWGAIARDQWFASINICLEIRLFENEFVVMPNHIHGIVWIDADDMKMNDVVGANGRSPQQRKRIATYTPICIE